MRFEPQIRSNEPGTRYFVQRSKRHLKLPIFPAPSRHQNQNRPASMKFCIEEKAKSSGAALLKLTTPVSVKAPKHSAPSSLNVSNFIFIFNPQALSLRSSLRCFLHLGVSLSPDTHLVIQILFLSLPDRDWKIPSSTQAPINNTVGTIFVTLILC